MITAAALLVLVALGLFVWGIVTGATALYWACVAVSAVAAVVLVVAFLRMRQAVTADEPGPARPAGPRADDEAVAAREPGPEPVAATRVLPAPGEGDGAVRGDGAHGDGAHGDGAHADDARHTVLRAGDPGHRADYEPNGPGSAGVLTGDGAPAGVASPTSPEHAAAPVPDDAPGAPPAADGAGDPPVEEVEVTDLLLVVDLHDDVYVVDEHPRYHLADCSWLAGRTAVPLPVDEARTDGFTPCGVCAPDHGLAERERGRRAAPGAS